MVKDSKITQRFYLLILAITIFIFFAPFLVSPSLLTAKDNDLGRTYIPMFNFIKKSALEDGNVPLWRPEQMMGETLVGNALYPIFYPLNIFIVGLPTEFFAVLFYLLHFLLAGITTFYLAKSFSFKNTSAFGAAVFYTFSTKMMVQMSAGHISMVAAFSIYPLMFLSIRKILIQPRPIWIVLGAVSVFFSLLLYPTIFYYSSLFLFFYSFYFVWSRKKNDIKKSLKVLIPIGISVAAGLGLAAIQLVPQLESGPLSSRSQLKLEEVALPLWNFKKFLTSLFFPYIKFDEFANDSFLYLGSVTSLLAIAGFIYISRSQKIVLAIFGILALLFVAGLSSPIFPLAYEFLPYLKYSRVSTRIWFVVALIVALLAAYSINRLKNLKIVYILIVLFLFESFFIGYKKILATSNLNFKNQEIYQFLASDKEIFRVYCTTNCFNRQQISKYDIQVLHGETPIQNKNFVSFLEQAGNYKHEKFAVIFPPYQVWLNDNPPVPDAKQLGKANVKYVASTYRIEHETFEFVRNFNDIFIYKNASYLPRAYFEDSNDQVDITVYSPNKIIVDFKESQKPRSLILAENFYPGWEAHVNGNKIRVEESDQIFRKINIASNLKNMELIYNPTSFKIGKAITLITLLFISSYLWYALKQKKTWRK